MKFSFLGITSAVAILGLLSYPVAAATPAYAIEDGVVYVAEQAQEEEAFTADFVIKTKDKVFKHTLTETGLYLVDYLEGLGYHSGVLRTLDKDGETVKLKNDEIVSGEEYILFVESTTAGKTETVNIPKIVEYEKTDELYKGEEIVKQKGWSGKALKTSITYEQSSEADGVTKKTEENFIIIKSPKREIIQVGTKECESEYSCAIDPDDAEEPSKEGYVHPLGKPSMWSTYSGHASHDGGGIDFPAATGTPIYAIADGVVSFAGTESAGGNIVHITHADGNMSVYAHMVELPIVKTGELVKAGKIIGFVGSTGMSTGPHLHLDVRVNGLFGHFYPAYTYLQKNGVNVGNCYTGACELGRGEPRLV